MANALEYPAIFKALLNGGYICKQQPVLQKVKYDLYQPEHHRFPSKYVGHITPKQFEQLSSHGIIEWNGLPSKKDKCGTVTVSYRLRHRLED